PSARNRMCSRSTRFCSPEVCFRAPTRGLIERNAIRYLRGGFDFEHDGKSQTPEQGKRFGQKFQMEVLARVEAYVQLGGAAFPLQLLEEIKGSAQDSEHAQ